MTQEPSCLRFFNLDVVLWNRTRGRYRLGIPGKNWGANKGAIARAARGDTRGVGIAPCNRRRFLAVDSRGGSWGQANAADLPGIGLLEEVLWDRKVHEGSQVEQAARPLRMVRERMMRGCLSFF
jgi:hypothetical protein